MSLSTMFDRQLRRDDKEIHLDIRDDLVHLLHPDYKDATACDIDLPDLGMQQPKLITKAPVTCVQCATVRTHTRPVAMVSTIPSRLSKAAKKRGRQKARRAQR